MGGFPPTPPSDVLTVYAPDEPNFEYTADNLPENLIMAIAHAARTAAPLFSLYRWHYGKTIPGEAELVETLSEITATLLNDAESEAIATGRFAVRRNRYEEETEIEIVLELSTTYMEPA